MTLKEELEILRGEPIQVFTGDPMDIPCIEASDSERLCKHPVVSVSMITYNHEPYIRQAIEGVMMQKTDFEFELVIGEDCSTDSTREICFEYQKRYPDKIRVLWCDHNLYRNPHPAGGNSRRNMAHCRGEFIALCEGDDYWIDPLKLQKQVDVMRKYPNVGLIFTNARILDDSTATFSFWWGDGFYDEGVVHSSDFLKDYVFNRSKDGRDVSFIMTASALLRATVYRKILNEYDIMRWRLRVGDKTLFIAMATLSDVYYIANRTSVYRRTTTGAMATQKSLIYVDSTLSRLYFILRYAGFLDVKCAFNVLAGCFGYLRERFGVQFSISDYRYVACVMRSIYQRRSWYYDMSFCSRLRWHLFFVTGSIHAFHGNGESNRGVFAGVIGDVLCRRSKLKFYARNGFSTGNN